MKAREAVDAIQKVNPDDEVIMLLWTKDTFIDYDDESTLTDDAWKKVVVTMEDEGGIDSGDQQISEMIAELVSEYSEPDPSIFGEEAK